MNINKMCIVLMVFIAVIGIIGSNSTSNAVYGAETWVKPENTSVYMTNFYVTIHATIKNNENHVQYFKISQTYTDSLDSPINWQITSKPGAVKMVDSVSPELNGDWGWKIQPGQTKTVCFTLLAVSSNNTGQAARFNILNKGSVANKYWPIIPDPGLYTSWFQPNEIEILNPSLDLKYWKGQFSFVLLNYDSHSVSGIIRAPIVPTDSKLVASSPKATFLDNDIVMNGKVAAWDVTLGPDGSDTGAGFYKYTYVWPYSGSSSSGIGKYSSTSIPTANAASDNSSASTKNTGIPYFPFVIGGILAAGGLAYARLR
ncbi:hypothetical protein [Methanobacterium sp.]|uniref:hypothetical protein n=1 Tax=Methanobacterium sp. TaxID=2164 RepID=UPI003C782118